MVCANRAECARSLISGTHMMRTVSRLLSAGASSLALLAGTVALAAPADAAYDDAPTPTWNWEPNGPVHAIAVSGDRVYIGGDFTSLSNGGQTVQRAHLAALDADTGDLSSWRADTDGDVRALALDGTRLFAGGGFVTVDGTRSRRLVALDAGDGSVIRGWKATANRTVRDLLVDGGTVYVGGQFTALSGVADRGLAALQASTGDRVNGFSASANGHVYGLSMSRGSLVAVGNFTQVNGLPRRAIATVDPSTGSLTSWTPTSLCNSCDKFWDVETDGDRAYVASGGFGGNRLGAFDLTTGLVSWSVSTNGDVQAVELAGDGLLYVGGHFNSNVSKNKRGFGGQFRTDLAAVVPASGAIDPDFAPDVKKPYPGVWALTSSSGALYAGGYFAGVDKWGRSPYVARFSAR